MTEKLCCHATKTVATKTVAERTGTFETKCDGVLDFFHLVTDFLRIGTIKSHLACLQRAANSHWSH
eukprot:m.294434 g.294434  ORF g.294434 m.294434 type:complete len:66 (-) comp15849_c1_seq6:902-1099(-)